LYGIAVSDLSITPSEVRKMTLGEIQSVIWAKTRHNSNDDWLEELYQDYKGAIDG